MFLRDLLLIEKSLTPAELEKHDGKYLRILIDLINADTDLPVDPAYRSSLGDTVKVDASEVPVLQAALDSGNIKANLPKKIKMYVNGKLIHSLLVCYSKAQSFQVQKVRKLITQDT
jgi:hypothetical protein